MGEVTAAKMAPLTEVVRPGYRAAWRLKRVLTDNGKEFKASFVTTCATHQVRHTRTKPRHAWTNGFVERLQGTILHEHWRASSAGTTFGRRGPCTGRWTGFSSSTTRNGRIVATACVAGRPRRCFEGPLPLERARRPLPLGPARAVDAWINTIPELDTLVTRNKKPQHWQPQLPRERNRSVVHQHVALVPTDKLEQLLETGRVVRVVPGPVTKCIAITDLPIFRGTASALDGLIVVVTLKTRKAQRYRERSFFGTEQRIAKIGIKRRQLLGAGLLGRFDVGPEAVGRTILWCRLVARVGGVWRYPRIAHRTSET